MGTLIELNFSRWALLHRCELEKYWAELGNEGQSLFDFVPDYFWLEVYLEATPADLI